MSDMNKKKTKISDKTKDIAEDILDFIDYYSTEILLCLIVVVVFVVFIGGMILEMYKAREAPVYYYADEYDLEAMARELGLEPEYKECGSHVSRNYISSACDDKGNYTYHYVIYVTDDAAYNAAQKYKLADTTSEAEDDDDI